MCNRNCEFIEERISIQWALTRAKMAIWSCSSNAHMHCMSILLNRKETKILFSIPSDVCALRTGRVRLCIELGSFVHTHWRCELHQMWCEFLMNSCDGRCTRTHGRHASSPSAQQQWVHANPLHGSTTYAGIQNFSIDSFLRRGAYLWLRAAGKCFAV